MSRGKIYSINCGGRILTTEKPIVMGILNVTPDSFFDGGKYFGSVDTIRRRADQIIEEGAQIIDIGAYSTRPGAADVSPEEEWRRLGEALDIVKKHHPDAIISVDTFRGEVARKCVANGAHIINDISAYEMDPDMLPAITDLRVPYILMHIKGVPLTMQNDPKYDGRATREVVTVLSEKVNELTKNGVADIIIDPGFGFGKTLDDNYQILADLPTFRIFDRPVLVGISHKSMIYKAIGGTPQTSGNGTTVLNTIALLGGADILRVHDVKECVETVQLVEMLQKNS